MGGASPAAFLGGRRQEPLGRASFLLRQGLKKSYSLPFQRPLSLQIPTNAGSRPPHHRRVGRRARGLLPDPEPRGVGPGARRGADHNLLEGEGLVSSASGSYFCVIFLLGLQFIFF